MKQQEEMHNVLITGGSGLMGRRLTEHLQARGHRVMWLSHKQKRLNRGFCPNGGIYYWDIDNHVLDERPLKMADTIIHLAGASVASGLWTADRRKEIIRSRVVSARMLAEALRRLPNHVQTYISASAIGYYGTAVSQAVRNESSALGDGFLAQTCALWEREADRLADSLGVRKVVFRNGVILSDEGGFLRRMRLGVRWGLSTPLGKGRQYINWIHVDDICGMYVMAVENNSLQGVYNAVGPAPVTNEQFCYAMESVSNMPMLLRMRVPAELLKRMLGELSTMLLGGERVSADKIEKVGFGFVYSSVNQALRELLR